MAARRPSRLKASTSNTPRYKVGDHVYVAPPYEQRSDGAPYVICRIMALPTPHPGEPGKARVAYYLRRRDVTNRSLADHRVIFATFMSGLIPLSHIRKKCRVMHRDYLEDPEAFKRQDDSFVFTQIYDRFMHKPFDLVPTSQVMNAPDNVLEYLRTNYEFVCTELGTSGELCDAMRGCQTCHAFAQKDDSVTCASCSRTWHLGCLDPPLLKKPALGWRWTCIRCSMQDEEEGTDNDNFLVKTSDRNQTRALAAARSKKPEETKVKQDKKGKGPSSEVQPQLDVAQWKMRDQWPYRYFGQHVDPTHILEDHDSIYPRASTRVGSRYQCSCIPGEEPDTSTKRRPPIRKPKSYKAAKSSSVTPATIEHERGGDDACTVIWTPHAAHSDADVEEYLRKACEHWTGYTSTPTVDFLVFALKILHESPSTTSALERLQASTRTKLPYTGTAKWSEQERRTFDENLETYDDELLDFKQSLPNKPFPEIVHYYYRERGYQRQHLNYEDPMAKDQDKFNVSNPSGVEAQQMEDNVDLNDNASIADEQMLQQGGNELECAVCLTHSADAWYRCPDGLGEHGTHVRKHKVMCPSCSIQWRYYGNPNPALTSSELDARAAKDGKGGRKKLPPKPLSTRSASPASTTGPASAKVEKAKAMTPTIPSASTTASTGVAPASTAFATQRNMLAPNGLTIKSCVLCKRPEPKALNYQCVNCSLSCHINCYGITEETNRDDWLCDLCNPVLRDDRQVQPCCPLCPPNMQTDQPMSALDVLKRTDGAGYLHLICAIWHPDLTFQNTAELDIIEGLATVELSKFAKTCSICNTSGSGACVRCEGCPKYFHVSCAWAAGYKFLFEILPVKKKRQKDVPIVKFKTEEGDMRPLIQCKAHPYVPTRLLYDLGQKDKATNLTALQTYAQNFKFTKIFETFPLLRRARRLDSIIHSALIPRQTESEYDSGLSESDIYEVKQPFFKEAKARPAQEQRKKAPAPKTIKPKSVDTVKANASNPVRVSSSATSTSAPAPPKSAATAKEKPRKRKKKEEDTDDYLSLSEDEVMPTASTSRAMKATREVTSVTKDVILDQRAPAVVSVRDTAPATSRSTQHTRPLVADQATKKPSSLALASQQTAKPHIRSKDRMGSANEGASSLYRQGPPPSIPSTSSAGPAAATPYPQNGISSSSAPKGHPSEPGYNRAPSVSSLSTKASSLVANGPPSNAPLTSEKVSPPLPAHLGHLIHGPSHQYHPTVQSSQNGVQNGTAGHHRC